MALVLVRIQARCVHACISREMRGALAKPKQAIVAHIGYDAAIVFDEVGRTADENADHLAAGIKNTAARIYRKRVETGDKPAHAR